MSRIGKKPISIPKGVKVNQNGKTIMVEGPKGSLSYTMRPEVDIEIKDDQINVSQTSTNRQARAFWGMTRALVANMVEGCEKGYEKKLDVTGVGYRAEVQGKKLKINVGFTHDVLFDIADGLDVSVDKNNQISINGADKQKVGQLAAEVRAVKPSDPYKLKGVKYSDEIIKKKVGKAGAK